MTHALINALTLYGIAVLSCAIIAPAICKAVQYLLDR